MTNLIAFRFTDNDYHSTLQEAITYVVQHREEDLSLDAWKEFVVRGMVAFNSLRRISEWGLEHCNPIGREYFDKWLTVSEVKSLDELNNFEGYIFDKNTFGIFYHGY